MSIFDEALAAKPPLGAALEGGVNTLSADEEVTFTQYRRIVLPVDGFVFWVRADQLSDSALVNTFVGDMVTPNQLPTVVAPAVTITAKGSLHYSIENRQDSDENFSINSVVFTSLREIPDLDAYVSPDLLYIGDFAGLRFAFSSQGNFYRQADLYHYRGDAIYPSMSTQIIENAADLDMLDAVVSNSLPFWMGLQPENPRALAYPPSLIGLFEIGRSPITSGIPASFYPPSQFIPIYPAYLLPNNIRPPYVVVEIDSNSGDAYQAVPLWNGNGYYQLVKDRVKLTLFGLRNFNAIDFYQYVINTIGVEGDPVGLVSVPFVKDVPRTQVEIGALAMKKEIVFEVSYYQQRMIEVYRQLIKSAFITTRLGA